jgi:hypothetical protein
MFNGDIEWIEIHKKLKTKGKARYWIKNWSKKNKNAKQKLNYKFNIIIKNL